MHQMNEIHYISESHLYLVNLKRIYEMKCSNLTCIAQMV